MKTVLKSRHSNVLTTKQRSYAAAGFSVVEVVLLLVVVGVIAGVGAFVMQQKHKADATINSSQSATTGSSKAVPNGTTTSVSQLTQQDAQTESGVDRAADNLDAQNATSANSSLTNVGGAYNENSL